MSYYTRVKAFLTGTTARGADVKAEFDSVEAGFAQVEADFNNFTELDQAVLDAQTAEYNAQQWAERAEDSPVETGKFSSLHWAAKSAASAVLAATFDPNSYYQKTWIDANIYTKSEIDSNTYTQTWVNANIYTKSATNTLLDGKLDSADIAWLTKTAAYTLVPGNKVIADTNGAAFTLTLPASPATGDWCEVITSGAYTNNLTIARNGQTIEGAAADYVCSSERSNLFFVFNGTTWKVGGGDTLRVRFNGTTLYMTNNGDDP